MLFQIYFLIELTAILVIYVESENDNFTKIFFTGRSIDQCSGTPARLCKTRYNTTAPMYGVSLTSGQPVTIVQKFPDLLQQVVFEVCECVKLNF